jgi:hypothetical protein
LKELADGRLPLRYSGTAEDIKKEKTRNRDRERHDKRREMLGIKI